MSIRLPSNKYEKCARYNMLVKQGSMSIEQAKESYRDFLLRGKQNEKPVQ